MAQSEWFQSVNRWLSAFPVDSWEVYREIRDALQFRKDRSGQESVQRGTVSGIAIRIIKDHHLGFAYTHQQDEPSIRQCVERAIASASFNSVSPQRPVFCESLYQTNRREYFDPVIEESAGSDRINDSAERWKYHQLDGAVTIERVWQEERVHRHLMNSNEADLICEETLFRTSGKWLVHSGGQSLFFEDESSSHFQSAINPSWLESVSMMTQSHPGKTPLYSKHGAVDLILAPAAGRTWLSHLFPAFRADDVMNNHSYLSGSDFGIIAPQFLTLTDDRTLPTAPGSVSFDGEGHHPRKTVLIAAGRFNGLITDSAMAQKSNSIPTGHTERDDQLKPYIMPGNLYIQNGNESADGIIRATQGGIWVYKLFDTPIDPITGAGSFGFEGLRIQDGELLSPCAGVTDSLSVKQWFRPLTNIGNDLIINNRVSTPTMKFSNLNVMV